MFTDLKRKILYISIYITLCNKLYLDSGSIYVGVIQSWFFVTGLFSDDPLDRNFKYFLKQNRVLLLALLCVAIMIVVYILLYDPILPSAKCPSNQGNIHERLSKNSITFSVFTPKVKDQGATKITTQ